MKTNLNSKSTLDVLCCTPDVARGARWASGLVLAAVVALIAACAPAPVVPSQPTTTLTTSSLPSTGNGAGNTPAQLTQAGWVCLNVPDHGVHCLAPNKTFGASVSIPVKVFETSNPADEDAPFLGTESLIRADRYQGQPCLPGHGEYFLLPFGYYSCHHFDF